MLPWQDKAKAVAHYRLHNLIDLHRNDAVAAEFKRRAARPRGT